MIMCQNYENLMGKYTNNIKEILSKVKNHNINSDLNLKLKNENDSLKHKLEMLDINKGFNFQNELTNFKVVLATEINHLINYLRAYSSPKVFDKTVTVAPSP